MQLPYRQTHKEAPLLIAFGQVARLPMQLSAFFAAPAAEAAQFPISHVRLGAGEGGYKFGSYGSTPAGIKEEAFAGSNSSQSWPFGYLLETGFPPHTHKH